MNIVNADIRDDYHMHTITYSDGLNSVDEMVAFAGNIGMRKIAITDHCQAYLYCNGFGKKTARNNITRWRNVYNDVEVIFGIEADLLNEKGDVSMDIQGKESSVVILSAHPKVYHGDPRKITQGYVSAIERFGDRITFLGHLCACYFDTYVEIEPVIAVAIASGVAFELNCANLVYGKTNTNKLRNVLAAAETLYINSDAHTLYELQHLRSAGMRFLHENGYL